MMTFSGLPLLSQRERRAASTFQLGKYFVRCVCDTVLAPIIKHNI